MREEGDAARDRIMVVIFPDGGRNCLSKLYNDEWMRANGLLTTTGAVVRVDEVLRARHHGAEMPDVVLAGRGPGWRRSTCCSCTASASCRFSGDPRTTRSTASSARSAGRASRSRPTETSVVERTIGEVDPPLPAVDVGASLDDVRSPVRRRRPWSRPRAAGWAASSPSWTCWSSRPAGVRVPTEADPVRAIRTGLKLVSMTLPFMEALLAGDTGAASTAISAAVPAKLQDHIETSCATGWPGSGPTRPSASGWGDGPRRGRRGRRGDRRDRIPRAARRQRPAQDQLPASSRAIAGAGICPRGGPGDARLGGDGAASIASSHRSRRRTRRRSLDPATSGSGRRASRSVKILELVFEATAASRNWHVELGGPSGPAPGHPAELAA